MSSIDKLLIDWQRDNGRHDLPWQQSRDPYAIWISEIMLQQTQVNTVIPYFQRFMQAFPTVLNLANASLDSVLALWSGLGYYSRARNLHAAAQEIVSYSQQHFPADRHALERLPGIGRSTAAAITVLLLDTAKQSWMEMSNEFLHVISVLAVSQVNLTYKRSYGKKLKMRSRMTIKRDVLKHIHKR